MNVVVFTVHLHQLGCKVLAHAVEEDAKTVDGVAVKDPLFSILRDEDQMNMHLENAVSAVSNFT
jgi:hypothetical protein